jgi:hypothetical protein
VKVATVTVPVLVPALTSKVMPPLAFTDGSLTLTVKVLESDWPSSVSVTVIVTV